MGIKSEEIQEELSNDILDLLKHHEEIEHSSEVAEKALRIKEFNDHK